MSFSSFQQFADGLCAQAGVTTPLLEPDADGLITFHMIVKNVIVNIVHPVVQNRAHDEDFLLVTFGDIPAGRELEVLTLLAKSNFSLMGSDMPVLCLNPDTAEVVLRQRVVPDETDPALVFESIMRLTDLALQWRADPTLEPDREGTRDAHLHPGAGVTG